MKKPTFNVDIEYMKNTAAVFNNTYKNSKSLSAKALVIRNRILEAMVEGKNNAAEQLYFDDGEEAYLRQVEDLIIQMFLFSILIVKKKKRCF